MALHGKSREPMLEYDFFEGASIKAGTLSAKRRSATARVHYLPRPVFVCYFALMRRVPRRWWTGFRGGCFHGAGRSLRKPNSAWKRRKKLWKNMARPVSSMPAKTASSRRKPAPAFYSAEVCLQAYASVPETKAGLVDIMGTSGNRKAGLTGACAGL